MCINKLIIVFAYKKCNFDKCGKRCCVYILQRSACSSSSNGSCFVFDTFSNDLSSNKRSSNSSQYWIVSLHSGLLEHIRKISMSCVCSRRLAVRHRSVARTFSCVIVFSSDKVVSRRTSYSPLGLISAAICSRADIRTNSSVLSKQNVNNL